MFWRLCRGRLRRRLAVAMDGELLESMRNPPGGHRDFFEALADRAAYWLVVSIYNVFPSAAARGLSQELRICGGLGRSRLERARFPGRHTHDEMEASVPFALALGLLATRLSVPVVPVRLDGIFELKAAGKRWARPGQITVSVGAPVNFQGVAAPRNRLPRTWSAASLNWET